MDNETQSSSNQEKENLAGEVMESLGMSEDSAASEEPKKESEAELPAYAKERLGKQQKRHDRDMKSLHRKIAELESRLMSGSQPEQSDDSYGRSEMAPEMDDQIKKAVAYALRAKEDQEQQAKEAEKQAYVQKQYQALHEQLDNGGGNYDDFDDVVRADDAPFTHSMRDTALLLPNPHDVLYKLGKNRDELKRISQLHPLEQAREMVKLSIALMGGQNQKQAASTPSKPMGHVKSSPVPSQNVNDKTPVSELRRLMKTGNKWAR